MKHNFTVEEVNIMCIFAGESRSEVIEDIEKEPCCILMIRIWRNCPIG